MHYINVRTPRLDESFSISSTLTKTRLISTRPSPFINFLTFYFSPFLPFHLPAGDFPRHFDFEKDQRPDQHVAHIDDNQNEEFLFGHHFHVSYLLKSRWSGWNNKTEHYRTDWRGYVERVGWGCNFDKRFNYCSVFFWEVLIMRFRMICDVCGRDFNGGARMLVDARR